MIYSIEISFQPPIDDDDNDWFIFTIEEDRFTHKQYVLHKYENKDWELVVRGNHVNVLTTFPSKMKGYLLGLKAAKYILKTFYSKSNSTS